MKRFGSISLLIIVAAMFACPPAGRAAEPANPVADYRIGCGDVLLVSVWKTEDLTREVIVLPDGTVSFPLVGRIMAAGRSLPEFEQDLKTILAPYIKDPVVTVSEKNLGSLFVYVIGRVNAPGRFVIASDVDVLQALAMAGGFNAYADKKDVKIFRKDGGKATLIRFNYKEFIEGNRLEQNVTLRRGDVVVVP